MQTNDSNRFIAASEIPQLEMCPDLRHLPPAFDLSKLTTAEVLKVITLALATAADADPLARLKAETVMNEQYSRGAAFGREQGERTGYGRGYQEGLEDGKREALDALAAEEAESATLKAAARARRSP